MVFLVVMFEEILFRIRAPVPDGIKANVSRDLSSIEVADETLSNISGELDTCQASNILDST